MRVIIPTKPSRLCCDQPMFWEWGEPDSQWDQAYPTSWHCAKCGCSELATGQEIRAMLEHEEALWDQRVEEYKNQIQQVPKLD